MRGEDRPHQSGQREEVNERGDQDARVETVAQSVAVVGEQQADVECQRRTTQLDHRLTERLAVQRPTSSSKVHFQ